MHDLKSWIGLVAGMISLSAYGFLVIAWKRGTFIPQRATWSIWLFVTGTIAASMFVGGVKDGTVFIPLGYCIGNVVIVSLSLKRGVGGWDKLDRWCIGVSVTGMALWVMTGNPITALALNILADMSASLPTVRKVWTTPESEDTLSWSVFLVGGTLSLFAVREWTFVQAGYSLFLVPAIALITLFTLRKPSSV